MLQGQWGLRLEREFKSKVNGRPMTSHCVERAVNVASCLVQKCGSHEREDRISVKISAIINELLVLQRSAIAQAERERPTTRTSVLSKSGKQVTSRTTQYLSRYKSLNLVPVDTSPPSWNCRVEGS